MADETTAADLLKEQTPLAQPMENEPVAKVLDLKRAYRRMTIDWDKSDADYIHSVKHLIDKKIKSDFAEAFDIEFDIYSVVRTVDLETGAWKQNEFGGPEEDWSKLSFKEREKFISMIAVRLFGWEQLANNIQFEALFAKVKYEESFAIGFESIEAKATVEARNQRAVKHSAEDKYRGLIMAYYSRQADSIVKSMDRICLRLKDLHPTR